MTRFMRCRSAWNGRRERHRQRADEGLRHHHRVVGELRSRVRGRSRARLFGPGDRLRLGESATAWFRSTSCWPSSIGFWHDVPVGLALLQVGQEARHVAGGVRGGAGRLEEGPVAGGLGVENVHAKREQERAGVLQRALVEVADQAADVPQREARRKARTDIRRSSVCRSAAGLARPMPWRSMRRRVSAVDHLSRSSRPTSS